MKNILITAVTLSLLFTLGCSGTKPSNIGLNNGQLAACPDKPNCVSSQTDDTDHFIKPIAYTITKEAAFQVLKKIIMDQERTLIVSETSEYLHVEFKTKVFRFVDDVEFYFPDTESVIHLRSASRIGYSDLGLNRKRIEKIQELFTIESEKQQEN